jgi:nitrogen fixation protein FixH
MTLPTDVEISRALNALSVTFRDQRVRDFDAARAQQIVQGALANEPLLEARASGPTSGELRIRDDGRLVATMELRDGEWASERKLRAGESGWAPPEPPDARAASSA